MFLPSGLMRKTLQRKGETPWEIVDRQEVAPVPMYDEDDDFEVVSVADNDMVVAYEVDVKTSHSIRDAVVSAQRQLLREISKQRYNALIQEGWQLTLMRNGNRRRVVVQYNGRPGRVSGVVHSHPPPFLAVTQTMNFA